MIPAPEISLHSFHIPVMGTSFTVDTPIRVAPFGISSVISLVDDHLLERMREYHCDAEGEEYIPIGDRQDDSRARRITSYLNLVGRVVKKRVGEIREAPFSEGSEICRFFEILDDSSPVKTSYLEMLREPDQVEKLRLQDLLRKEVRAGSIDVNIMTKLDRENYKNGKKLDREYTDAVAALRGFAKSELEGAVVFSAGVNPRLYTSAAGYDDFFAVGKAPAKKRVIIKVSDFRSALTQGRVFAKKGIWVSEFRIESSVNCGGHAFPTGGHLLGPILDEFLSKREELIGSLFEIYRKAALEQRGIESSEPPTVRFSVQGGIGTSCEDQFLRRHFHLDGTGWATPFLLVPEATSVDDETLAKLIDAEEKDLYLSTSSPLGVPFNNLKNSESERVRLERIAAGKPGSPCPNGYLAYNTDYTEVPICVASRAYQRRKLDDLRSSGLGAEELAKEEQKVTEKSCICSDLGAGAILKYGIPSKRTPLHAAICPGPNLAYFSKLFSLKEMISHIYGREQLLNPAIERPNLFLKELKIYLDYYQRELAEALPKLGERIRSSLMDFRNNLQSGIDYYRGLAEDLVEESAEYRAKFSKGLADLQAELDKLVDSHGSVFELHTA